jgi:coenzyme F420-reducing hydrogenase alpha subunit
MSPTKGEPRTIRVDYLARVEGETSLTVRLEGGRAVEAQLAIFEPPRFFEALLRGRSYLEAPDITSRICGICPIAYMTSACNAMEDALGITLPDELAQLRRLIYCGEWIESHALHVFMLHAPDFLGAADAVELAKRHGDWVRKGLRIKKAGNAIVALLGGREIHPINVRVGGFYRVPTKVELDGLLPELRWAKEASAEALRWMATFEFPSLERDWELVALSHPDEYAITRGRVVSSRGIDIEPRAFEEHFAEEHVGYSHALRARRIGGGAYLCGPLARYNLGFDHLRPEIQAQARAIGLAPPMLNPFRALLVRLVEIQQAFADAIEIIERHRPPARPFVDAQPRAASGFGVSEAPRGLLYHRYRIDEGGAIVEANIVPPTSQNQLAIEEDLLAAGTELAALPIDEATRRAEQAVRNHDPCISCATHFLQLRFEHT